MVSRRRQAGHSQTPDKVGWSVGDVDLFEINEALRSGTMAAQKDRAFRERTSTSMAVPVRLAIQLAPRELA